jgi:hypothetical protein
MAMSPWTILAGLLLLLGAAASGYYEGHQQEKNVLTAQLATIKAADAAQLAKEEAAARATEQADAQHLAVITQTYEQDKANDKKAADATIASLRAGTLKLRAEWSCTPQLAASVSAAASGGSGADAAAEQRYQDAATLVRNADDADATIRALQAVVASDRQQFSTTLTTKGTTP